MARTREFETIAFAMEKDQINHIVKELKKAGYHIESEGSWSNRDGHGIVGYMDSSKDDEVFRALIHRPRSSYLVRAAKGLLTPVE